MHKTAYIEVIKKICRNDPRYDIEAYIFMREALDYTIKAIKQSATGDDRHVSGRELTKGLRNYALQEFGPMAFTVLTSWGIKTTRDFGEIVFNLVGAGELGKREEDNIDDFNDVYDFHTEFELPFLPEPPA
jgi:uncharacterized repeat protein (TIGR04138 family)